MTHMDREGARSFQIGSIEVFSLVTNKESNGAKRGEGCLSKYWHNSISGIFDPLDPNHLLPLHTTYTSCIQKSGIVFVD